MKKKAVKHITPADGNIFADLKLKDAENLKLRAQLMVEIRRYIEENDLTQAAAAKAMGITQPRLNDVVKGRIEKCTIDRMVNMLAAVGCRVSFNVSEAA